MYTCLLLLTTVMQSSSYMDICARVYIRWSIQKQDVHSCRAIAEPRQATDRATKRTASSHPASHDEPSSDHQTTSRAAPPSSDHQTTRPRPERLHQALTTRPPDHVAMMIATKNGAMTTTTTVTIGRKARGPDNFIATDQISIKDKYTSNIYI